MFKRIVITALMFLMVPLAQGGILNRNLLEVDRQVYTQRDFEIYVLTKESLFYRNGIAPVLVRTDSWSLLLNRYKDEMLVNGLFNQEAQRLSSFLPNGDMIKKSQALVLETMKKSSVLMNRFRELDVSKSEIKSQLVQILKVQAYLKSKANKLGQKSWFYRVDKDALWFKRIQQAMPYRFFDNANHFKKLQGL